MTMIDHRIYYPQQSIVPVTKTNDSLVQNSNNQVKNGSTAFNQVLTQELNGVQFSQHALQRLQARNIKLEPADLTKINQAVEKAAQKGAKDSLVLMNRNSLALVVSVKNKTVITAMDSVSMKDNVFTNIDSAVII